MWYVAHGWTSPAAGSGEVPREISEIFGLKGVAFSTAAEAFKLASQYGGWVEPVIG